MKVAICFYTPESFEKLKAVAADKNKLDNTYEDWLVGFHNVMTNFNSTGVDAIALKINIEELEKWCKVHNYKNTGKNRAEYASEMVQNTD